MNCKKVENYYIGTDMGTDSLGIAVTDENYNVLSFNSKAMWTTHLFDSGNTAEERRLFRTARRRTSRKKHRISLLQELFDKEIIKEDPDFFLRLRESMYIAQDKTLQQKNTLFNDEDYDDKKYHEQYPTIYHLRKALIHEDKEFDIRLLYLAVAHIIKNRGHFLFEGQDLESSTSFSVVFEDLLNTLEDYGIELHTSSYEEISDTLKNPKIGITSKKKILYGLLGCETKQQKAVANILTGAKTAFSDIFDDETLKDATVPKISLSEDYSEKLDDIQRDLEDRMYVLEKLKAVYDWAVLADILKGKEYLSDTKTDIYDKHKSDLVILKKAVRNNAPEKYNDVFRNNKEKNNYCAYSAHPSDPDGVLSSGFCTREDFGKYVLSVLKDMPDSYQDAEYIRNEIASNTFLPKQTTKDNSVIPYQINLHELTAILDNQKKYHPFLLEKDDSGLTVYDKILSILTFRIPYYVGPLNSHSDNAWIVKRSAEKIYPWNFKDVVDEQSSAEKFIERMTNFCTYLVGESVLPKDSVIYSEYVIYNQLNNVAVDGIKLSISIKNELFRDLFINRNNKVSSKTILNYLLAQGYTDNKNAEISGIDGAIVGTMKAYHDFRKIIKEKASDLKMVDDIVSKIVILPGSEKMLSAAIKNKYADILTDMEIKELCKLKYSGWGRMSEKFLTGIYDVDKETGEAISIIDAMKKTDCNLMQLLSSDFGFAEAVDNFNKEANDGRPEGCSAIDALAVSPAIKRSIRRTTEAIKEVVSIMGKAPSKIFVEMARGASENQKKKRTISRKQQVLDLYKSCGKDCAELMKKAEATPESQFRSDTLFLYYTQMGRSMYTGKPIKLEDLFNRNVYDIDHIYPQSKVKDDSLDNRVLCEREINGKKDNTYPLPDFCRKDEALSLWRVLSEKKLISKEKFNRLMRRDGFSDSELAGFISRQLVETRQSTKAVANILKETYPDTKIVYVKAKNVSEFRQQYDIIKCRSVNDYHHAKDAYLNIVVGNVYSCKFSDNPVNFIKKVKADKNMTYSMNRVFDYPVLSKGKVVWEPKDGKSISEVKKQVNKNNIRFTRYAYCTSGGFFDQMPVKKGLGQLQLKTSDKKLSIENYGGYNKISGSYFMLLEHTLKGKTVRTIEYVPVYIAKKIDSDKDIINRYIRENYTDAKVLLSRIKINSLFKVDGFPMHLSGRTGNRLIFKGAVQLVISDSAYITAKRITGFVEKNREEKEERDVSPLSKITKEDNLALYDELSAKIVSGIYGKRFSAQIPVLTKGREKFINLSVEKQCSQLYEMLHLFQCNSILTDLTSIGGAGKAGILLLSKNIDDVNSVKIVNQSVTGLFETEIDLKSL